MPSLLVIEDGSVVANANTYASAADLVSFANFRGLSIPSDQTSQEQLLLKAMDYIEPLDWLGRRFKASRDQPLEWPRYDVIIEGWPVYMNEIPRQLIYLQCCVAIEYQSNELLPTFLPNQHGSVASEEVEGVVRIAYENNGRVLKTAAIEKADRWIQVLTRKRGTLTVIRT